MPSNSGFTINQEKVCENVELKMKLVVQIEILESEYKEVMDLFKLFNHFSEKRFHNYTSCFNERIIVLKKLLKNTQKRLDYNMIRC